MIDKSQRKEEERKYTHSDLSSLQDVVRKSNEELNVRQGMKTRYMSFVSASLTSLKYGMKFKLGSKKANLTVISPFYFIFLQ